MGEIKLIFTGRLKDLEQNLSLIFPFSITLFFKGQCQFWRNISPYHNVILKWASQGSASSKNMFSPISSHLLLSKIIIFRIKHGDHCKTGGSAAFQLQDTNHIHCTVLPKAKQRPLHLIEIFQKGLNKGDFISAWVVGIRHSLSSLVNKGRIVPLLHFWNQTAQVN